MQIVQRFFLITLFLLGVVMVLGITTVDAAQYESTTSLAERVGGFILLQVEEHGEAWYVNPEDHLKYYMPDGETAYRMLYDFGLGITNSDIGKIPAVKSKESVQDIDSACEQSSLANRLRGRILLQVEEHGEAWYVHPEKCLRIYMGNGADAFYAMKYWGRGITNSDLAQIEQGALLDGAEMVAAFYDHINSLSYEQAYEMLRDIDADFESFANWYSDISNIKNFEFEEITPSRVKLRAELDTGEYQSVPFYEVFEFNKDGLRLMPQVVQSFYCYDDNSKYMYAVYRNAKNYLILNDGLMETVLNEAFQQEEYDPSDVFGNYYFSPQCNYAIYLSSNGDVLQNLSTLDKLVPQTWWGSFRFSEQETYFVACSAGDEYPTIYQLPSFEKDQDAMAWLMNQNIEIDFPRSYCDTWDYLDNIKDYYSAK